MQFTLQTLHDCEVPKKAVFCLCQSFANIFILYAKIQNILLPLYNFLFMVERKNKSSHSRFTLRNSVDNLYLWEAIIV